MVQNHPLTLGYQIFADMYQQQNAVLQQMMAMQVRLVESVVSGRPSTPPPLTQPQSEADDTCAEAEAAVAAAVAGSEEEEDEDEDSEEESSTSQDEDEDEDEDETTGLRIATY